jgi:AcrR family transcriptional regulator
MDAALRLFRARGIRATTIRDLAAAAGVTSGALYRHYPGKTELAQAVFATCAERLGEALRPAADGEDPRAALRALIRALLEFSRQEPLAYGFLMERHEEEVQRAEPGRELPKDFFERTIRAGVQQGVFPAQDVNLAAALVIGMAQRAIFFYDRGMVESSWEETAARVADAAVTVIGEVGKGVQ